MKSEEPFYLSQHETRSEPLEATLSGFRVDPVTGY